MPSCVEAPRCWGFRGSPALPIGSIVVPFWDYPKYIPQKGTAMEPRGMYYKYMFQKTTPMDTESFPNAPKRRLKPELESSYECCNSSI